MIIITIKVVKNKNKLDRWTTSWTNARARRRGRWSTRYAKIEWESPPPRLAARPLSALTGRPRARQSVRTDRLPAGTAAAWPVVRRHCQKSHGRGPRERWPPPPPPHSSAADPVIIVAAASISSTSSSSSSFSLLLLRLGSFRTFADRNAQVVAGGERGENSFINYAAAAAFCVRRSVDQVRCARAHVNNGSHEKVVRRARQRRQSTMIYSVSPCLPRDHPGLIFLSRQVIIIYFRSSRRVTYCNIRPM